MKVKPVILCGGSGTRLWPLSTPQEPKQFQSLTAKQSMIELTSTRLHAKRIAGLEIDQTLVVGSKKHETLLRSQLPDARLILEPFGRNSAPAVAAACIVSDPSDLLLILPADHHIEKPEVFLEAIASAHHAAADGAIVTFGVKPTHPATGYGYIRSGVTSNLIKPVAEFVEKPPLEKAEQYARSGMYYWNAGIFLFRTSSMIEAFQKFAPEVLETVESSISSKRSTIIDLDPNRFEDVQDVSIDYAIMEREKNINVVPVDMGWSDVGGYDALWEMFSENEHDNVTFGPVITDQSRRLYVRSEGPLVSVSGLDNITVVAKPDVVMISPRSDPDSVKRLGSASQTNPDAHSITMQTSSAAKSLMWGAFECWGTRAWDTQNGGFVESLSMAGVPQPGIERRVRVQARQVFSYAQALLLGYENESVATAHVMNGLQYLSSTCRHPDEGWVHRISEHGRATDSTRDLYDHAFIILAGAAAYRATGKRLGLELAEEALSFIDSRLKDSAFGGYVEGMPADAKHRRANPHMHLLEAFLELFEATQDQKYLDRATEIVSLFERHFFDPQTDLLREYFEQDWSIAKGKKGQIFEPGHHYEWASLLCFHSRLTGRDTISWRRRLIATADRYGCENEPGFACNSVYVDGKVADDSRRIWHQLEKFRARLLHPETAFPGAADTFFAEMKTAYFNPMPNGIWIDDIDHSGQVRSKAVPASILYHVVTALKPALRINI